jgi:hypothetical protein
MCATTTTARSGAGDDDARLERSRTSGHVTRGQKYTWVNRSVRTHEHARHLPFKISPDGGARTAPHSATQLDATASGTVRDTSERPSQIAHTGTTMMAGT